MRWRRACAGCSRTPRMRCWPRLRWPRWRWRRATPGWTRLPPGNWWMPSWTGRHRRRGWRSCRHRHGWHRPNAMTRWLPMHRWYSNTACCTCAVTANTNAAWRWACSASPRILCRRTIRPGSPRCSPSCSRRRWTASTTRRARRQSRCAIRWCWSPAVPVPARPPPSHACWCCWPHRRSRPALRCHGWHWPRPPAVPPSAWPTACARRCSGCAWSVWRPNWPRPCRPPAPPCTGCWASFPIRRASAITPTTRCRTTSWWWTRPR